MKNYYYYYIKQNKVLEKHNELIDFIDSISSIRSEFVIKPQNILSVPENNQNKINKIDEIKRNIVSINSKVLNIVRTKRPSEIFTLINNYISDLNLFDSSYNDDNLYIKKLKDFTEKHTDAYSEKQPEHLFNITELSLLLSNIKRELTERSNLFINSFNDSIKKVPDNYSVIKIGTDRDIPIISDFTSVFIEFEKLYAFFGYIHKVDVKSNVLLINFISTGSWYTELLGIKQVVVSIENLLIGIGGFIRDLITGKISRERFENQCKKAEAFIDLIAKAKENGIDNAEVGIFKALNPFIDSVITETTTIDINGQEILGLKEHEKLTLLNNEGKRDKLLNKIKLSIDAKKDDKNFEEEKGN